MKAIWTPISLENLDSIYNYIGQHSPQNALEMIDRITSRVWQLEEFPFSGHVVPEYNDRRTTEVLVDSYRLIYRISENEIQIVNVIHGACLLSPKRRRDS